MDLLALRHPSTKEGRLEELGSILGGPIEVFDPPPRPAVALAASPRVARSPGSRRSSAALAPRAAALAPSFDAVVLLDDYAGAYARHVVGGPAVLSAA